MTEQLMVIPNQCVDGAVPGDTSWVLVSSGLVLLMTPALAMFEAGLLRSKNTLSIMTQCMSGVISLSLLWVTVGFSLVYGDSLGGIIGSPLTYAFFIDVSYTDCSQHAPTVSTAAFALFQMMFAVITPLLITGAYAERVSFKLSFTFSLLWELFVYYPVAHSVWGGGLLEQWGVLDFAGGITIHTTAGVSAFVAAVMIGQRRQFKTYMGDYPPSSLPLAVTGASLLWLGWFGFNGGSALRAGATAVSAVISTQVGAVSSASVWLCLSWFTSKPSTTSTLNGIIAGLAGITPASGYINTPATLILGFILGGCSFYGQYCLKHYLQIDDALDVSMVHGLTGMIGSVWLGIFAQLDLNPEGADGWWYGNPSLFAKQLAAVAIVTVYSAVATFIILKVLYVVLGTLRLSDEAEEIGADWSEHGEIAYHKLHVLDESRYHDEYSVPSTPIRSRSFIVHNANANVNNINVNGNGNINHVYSPPLPLSRSSSHSRNNNLSVPTTPPADHPHLQKNASSEYPSSSSSGLDLESRIHLSRSTSATNPPSSRRLRSLPSLPKNDDYRKSSRALSTPNQLPRARERESREAREAREAREQRESEPKI